MSNEQRAKSKEKRQHLFLLFVHCPLFFWFGGGAVSGGTLIVSRAVKLHEHFKKRFETFGFEDVTLTAADRDALIILINKINPGQIIMGAGYYYSATPYMMAGLVRQFPDIKFASVSIGEYPADIAAGFTVNGVTAYVNYWDGVDQFYHGLDCIRRGKGFISESVQERTKKGYELPRAAKKLAKRELEVVRLLCNGFKSSEIGDVLHISIPTVNSHKTAIYQKLYVNNENELIGKALVTKIVKLEELLFFSRERDKMRKEKREQLTMSREQRAEKLTMNR